jgi:hypothetical protein
MPACTTTPTNRGWFTCGNLHLPKRICPITLAPSGSGKVCVPQPAFAAVSQLGLSILNNTRQVEGTRFIYTKELKLVQVGQTDLKAIKQDHETKDFIIGLVTEKFRQFDAAKEVLG